MKSFTNDAIKTTRENIARLYAKLGSTRPNDEWTMDDIRNMMFYLKLLDQECASEQYARKRASNF